MKYKLFRIIFLVSFFYIQTASTQTKKDAIQFVNLFSSNMKEGVSCYRIPSIITVLNGDINTAIDERVPSCGDLKWSNNINIVMRRSTDNGASWSNIKTIVDYPLGESASDPSMILDEITGELFLFFNYIKSDNDVKLFSKKDISVLLYLKLI